MLSVKSRPNASLFVGNLGRDVSESLLFEKFSIIGSILSTRIFRSFGYALVNFEQSADAYRALNFLNGVLLGGQKIILAWYNKLLFIEAKTKSHLTTHSAVIISNFDPDIAGNMFCETFSAFGQILGCHFVVDTSDTMLPTRALVLYATQEMAANVISKVNGMLTITGRRIKVTKYLISDNNHLSTLYVGNLPKKINEAMLFEVFAASGRVHSIRVCRDWINNESLGFAYINFQDPEDAERTLVLNNNKHLMGQCLCIVKLPSDFNGDVATLKENIIFVVNLDDGVVVKDLLELFGGYGKIIVCHVERGVRGEPKGYGSVVYENEKSVERSIFTCNGILFHGRKLFVHNDLTINNEEFLKNILENEYNPWLKPKLDVNENYSLVIDENTSWCRNDLRDFHEKNPLRNGNGGIIEDPRSRENSPILKENGVRSKLSGPWSRESSPTEENGVWSRVNSPISVNGFWSYEMVKGPIENGLWVQKNESLSNEKDPWLYETVGIPKLASLWSHENNASVKENALFAKEKDIWSGDIFSAPTENEAKNLNQSSSNESSPRSNPPKENLERPKLGLLEPKPKPERPKLGLLEPKPNPERPKLGLLPKKEVEKPKLEISKQPNENDKKPAKNAEPSELDVEWPTLDIVSPNENAVAAPIWPKLKSPAPKKEIIPTKNAAASTENVKKSCNIFVKNINDDVDDKQLKLLFKKYGKIISTRIVHDDKRKNKGYAFVNFTNSNSAENAIEGMHGRHCEGRELHVSFYQEKSERDEILKKHLAESNYKYRHCNLFIKNLDVSIDDDRLRKEFKPFGTITSAKVMRFESGASKGFGFVSFSSIEEAEKAQSKMHGHVVLSKPLYVNVAQLKDERVAMLTRKNGKDAEARTILKDTEKGKTSKNSRKK